MQHGFGPRGTGGVRDQLENNAAVVTPSPANGGCAVEFVCRFHNQACRVGPVAAFPAMRTEAVNHRLIGVWPELKYDASARRGVGTHVATGFGHAKEVSRRVHDQAAKGVVTVGACPALRTETVKHGFGPSGVGRIGRQLEHHAAVVRAACFGCAEVVPRAIHDEAGTKRAVAIGAVL
jgi:hypothetical protein